MRVPRTLLRSPLVKLKVKRYFVAALQDIAQMETLENHVARGDILSRMHDAISRRVVALMERTLFNKDTKAHSQTQNVPTLTLRYNFLPDRPPRKRRP